MDIGSITGFITGLVVEVAEGVKGPVGVGRCGGVDVGLDPPDLMARLRLIGLRQSQGKRAKGFALRRVASLRVKPSTGVSLGDPRLGFDGRHHCDRGPALRTDPLSQRAKGFEPSTSSLGSWHSTTELRPRVSGGRSRRDAHHDTRARRTVQGNLPAVGRKGKARPRRMGGRCAMLTNRRRSVVRGGGVTGPRGISGSPSRGCRGV